MAKKVLVVSDSHGRNENLRRAISVFGPAGEQLSMLIHLGDMQCPVEKLQEMVQCPVEAVKGNCDIFGDLPMTRLIELGREKVLLTHGHRYNCKWSTEPMKELAQANGAGVVLFGHTHVPLVDRSPDVKLMNPGSISEPRQEGRRPTYLVITIEEDGHLEFAVVAM